MADPFLHYLSNRKMLNHNFLSVADPFLFDTAPDPFGGKMDPDPT